MERRMSNHTTQGIPGMDAMNETLDFVKNLWGGMSMPGMNMKIPGMIMPTLSVEEINKQIADLKTVESWLTLNMNMLRSTIQALEVQSATISTLQAMGESLSAAVKPAPREEPRKPEPAPEPEPEAKQPETEAPAPKAKAKKAAQADAAAALANPAIWWNMLQDQFKQAVDSAMTAEAPKPAPAKPAKAAGKAASTGKAKKAVPKAAAPKAAPNAVPKAPKAPAPKATLATPTTQAKHAGTKGG
jgi:hypothetical protein